MEIKKVIRTEDTLFKNSQCLFVEYSDILKAPFLLLLRVIQSSKVCNTIFDLSFIKEKNLAELYLWYLHRKNFNPYREFPIKTEIENFDDGFYDYLLREHLNSAEVCYQENTELAFSVILKNLLKENDSHFIHRVVIYDEYNEKFVKDDVSRLYQSSRIQVEVRSGDFKSAIANIPNDSSYVLADINRILDLKDVNKLNLSSILLPYDYDYNFYPESKSYKIDLESLSKEFTFKINFFENKVV